MAVFRPGPLAGGVSGNLGACNFVQGIYGPYIRRRLVRSDKTTERQLVERVRLKTLKNTWLDLSDEQKDVWHSMARGVKKPNRLGIPRGVGGHELYISVNLWILEAGLTIQVTPPGALNTPPPWDVTFTVNLPNTYDIGWTGQAGLGGFINFIFSARPVVGHIVKPIKHWRFTYESALLPDPIDVKDEFIAQWGVPRVGEYVAVKMHLWADYHLRSFGVVAGCIVT